jgi:hypothetical protein
MDEQTEKPPAEEELRTTQVPVMKNIPEERRARTSLLSEFNAKRVWMVIAGALLITNIVSPLVLTQMLTKEQLIIALDGANTFHVGPAKEMESSQEIMSTHALLASIALLQRSAAGFDLPEVLKQLYNSACGERATKELAKAMPDIKIRNERWRPEVSKVEMIKMDAANLFSIRVAGQLVKTGIAAGSPFESVQNYTLILKLIKNPRLTQNARYPLVVYDYELRMEAPLGGPGTKPVQPVPADVKGQDARKHLMDAIEQEKGKPAQ